MFSDKEIKVCQVVSYSADSEYLRNLGLGLAGKGVAQLWVTLFDSGKEQPAWINEAKNMEYLCLDARSRYGFPFAALRLAKKLRQGKFKIVQTHLYEASLVGLLAGKLAGTHVKVLTRHHLDQALLIGKSLPIYVDKWEARTADHIVTLGGAVKEHLVNREGVPDEKITVVYQGFDFNRFSATESERLEVRKEFGVDEGEFLIGTFGNFFPTKGHRFLLDAVSVLMEKYPNIRLFFVGGGGEESGVVDYVSKTGLDSKVKFAGFRKDVAACMKACDLVVHPSLSEAFCQVLIETMSVGTPLISTDVGGAKEVIEDGVTGTLVPPADAASLEKAVEEVLSDRARAEAMANVGQSFVRNTFTLERMIDRQYELYCQWLGMKT
ncbi:MAG TPA: glycosyltransferase family 4 protein [Pyrinomonadaceae bacterium]|nr:glycosyltransferase family 4 protein [Pyrinomonadaceae bacterium]